MATPNQVPFKVSKVMMGVVTSGAPVVGATVQITSPSGAVLGTALQPTSASGMFIVPISAPLPASYRVTSTHVSGQTTDHLVALVDDGRTGFVVVDPYTTLVSKYVDLHPGLSTRTAMLKIKRNSVAPTLLAGATKQGSVDKYVSQLAGRIDPPTALETSAGTTGTSDDDDDDDDESEGEAQDLDTMAEATSSISNSMLSSFAHAVAAPVAGWLTAAMGIHDGTATALKAIQGQLDQINSDMDSLFKYLGAIVVDTVDQAAIAPDVSYAQTTYGHAKSSGTPADVTDSDNTSHMQNIHNMQTGNAPKSTAYISSFIDTYTPRFYCDDTQLPIILTQYIYYQKAQFMLMHLLVDACHNQVPPDYTSAKYWYDQYTNFLQFQSSFLPFSSHVPNEVDDSLIYDRDKKKAWVKINFDASDLVSLTNGYMNFQNTGGLRLATNDELASLVADLGTAYNAALNKPASTATPDVQTMLNYFGFTLSLSTPVVTMDFVNTGYTPAKATDAFGSATAYTFPAYDVSGNKGEMLFQVHCRNYSDDWQSDFGETISVDYTYGDDFSTQTVSSTGYIGMMFIYDFGSGDPPIEEPSAISIDPPGPWAAGAQQLTATGTFTNRSSDVSEYVFWSVDDDTVMTISNDPYGDGVGWAKWLKTTGSVKVTITRGNTLSNTMLIKAPGVAAPAPAPSSFNLTPRNQAFSQLPASPLAQGSVAAQIVMSDSTTVLDPWTISPPPYAVVLSSSDPALTFVSGQPGNFTIGTGVASATITIDASVTGTTLKDSVTIQVPYTPPK